MQRAQQGFCSGSQKTAPAEKQRYTDAGRASRQAQQPESRRTNELNPAQKEEMAYRTTPNVKEEFRAHPRRALIMTTVDHESRAVKAHITDSEILSGKNGFYGTNGDRVIMIDYLIAI